MTNSAFTNFLPRASSEGKYIFFASYRTGENHVWRMNLDGTDQTQITKVEGGYPRFVSSDENSVFFLSGHPNALDCLYWRKERQMLGDLGGDQIADLAVSPDGTTLAFTRGKWISNAVLMEGLK